MIRVRLTNKERFFNKLKSTVPKIKDNLTDANRKSAEQMVDTAQRLVPVEQGDLRESVRMYPGRAETSFVVEAGGAATTKPVRKGADASYDYALGQEFGTREMPAQPFFWPSYRVMKRGHKGRATRAMRKAIKEAGF